MKPYFSILLLLSFGALIVCGETAEEDVDVAPTVLGTDSDEVYPLRNPFWPVGYEGERAIIAAAVIRDEDPETEPEQTAVDQKPRTQIITQAHWLAARKELRFGGITKARRVEEGATNTTSVVLINGYHYQQNDLISVNCDGVRFTWRILGIPEKGVVRMAQIRAVPLRVNKKRNAKN